MRNEEIKELLDARLSGFKAEIRASLDMQIYKLDRLIDYQEKQNGRMTKIEVKVDKNTDWRKRIVAGTFAIVSVLGGIIVWVVTLIDKLRK